MAIPTISSYSIPPLPTQRTAHWQLDPRRAALLVHDMQNYFINAYDKTSDPIRTVITNIQRLIHQADQLAIPVFFSAQPPQQHPHRRGLVTQVWGQGLQTADEAAIIDELLSVVADDYEVITKWRYSAFERTDLAQSLSYADKDQLIIAGVYAHMGCQVSAVDAFMKDIEPFMIADAIADFSRHEHADALEWVSKRCGVVLSTDDALAAMSTAPTSSPAAQAEKA